MRRAIRALSGWSAVRGPLWFHTKVGGSVSVKNAFEILIPNAWNLQIAFSSTVVIMTLSLVICEHCLDLRRLQFLLSVLRAQVWGQALRACNLLSQSNPVSTGPSFWHYAMYMVHTYAWV